MCYLESSSVGNRNGMEYKRFTFVLWATVNAHIQISWFTWEMYSYEVHQLWLSATKNVSCGKGRRQKPNQIASLSEVGMSNISFLSYCWWWLLFSSIGRPAIIPNATHLQKFHSWIFSMATRSFVKKLNHLQHIFTIPHTVCACTRALTLKIYTAISHRLIHTYHNLFALLAIIYFCVYNAVVAAAWFFIFSLWMWMHLRWIIKQQIKRSCRRFYTGLKLNRSDKLDGSKSYNV